ncbi:MAG: SDR family oxidoreductase [Candidatus Bilamarchaeaceae archaeon]
MMADVLVTGGAGFIGSHLCERLLKEGHTVVCLDDLSSGKEENVVHLLSNSKFSFVKGDIRELSLLKDLIRGSKTEYVFHEAAKTSVPESIRNPKDTGEVNVKGTLNLLNACKECGVKKVVLASSAAVYGDSPEKLKFETQPPKPKSPYAESKLQNEKDGAAFTKKGLPVVCLRYFNVYGPRQDTDGAYASVIPRFISNAVRGKPLPLFGDGKQTRDFIFVDDVVDANLLAMFSGKADGKALNVASGSETAIIDLANSVLTLTRSKSKFEFQKDRPGDIKYSLASIALAKEMLGFRPKTSLEDGLKRTVEWFISAL